MGRNDPPRSRKRSRARTTESAPRGREETMTAVLRAAAELFADRSPAQVTIREIAQRANVNHSLVHRHFGTKAELLKAVIRQSTDDYIERIGGTIDPANAFRSGFLYGAEEHPEAAALTRAVLDGFTPSGRERNFPMMTRHIRTIEAAIEAEDAKPWHSAEVIAAAAFALMSGWFILEDWLMEAASLSEYPLGDIREQIADILASMVAAEAGLEFDD
jgi:TetR/AcrR family transcriptional regulator, repressor for neighboring sulfatase